MNLIEEIRIYRDLKKVAKEARTMTMQNWKTTVFGLIGGAALAIGNYSGPNTWHGYVAAVAIAVIGLLARDFNVTLSDAELTSIKNFLSKSPVLLFALMLGTMLLPATALAQATLAPKCSPTGLSVSSDAVALKDPAGSFSAATIVKQSFDALDFGAGKCERLYLEGTQAIFPSISTNFYGGGVAIQPNLVALFKDTNIPAGKFGVTLDGGVGLLQLSTKTTVGGYGGGALKYNLGAVSWTTLRVEFFASGGKLYEAYSTGLTKYF